MRDVTIDVRFVCLRSHLVPQHEARQRGVGGALHARRLPRRQRREVEHDQVVGGRHALGGMMWW